MTSIRSLKENLSSTSTMRASEIEQTMKICSSTYADVQRSIKTLLENGELNYSITFGARKIVSKTTNNWFVQAHLWLVWRSNQCSHFNWPHPNDYRKKRIVEVGHWKEINGEAQKPSRCASVIELCDLNVDCSSSAMEAWRKKRFLD